MKIAVTIPRPAMTETGTPVVMTTKIFDGNCSIGLLLQWVASDGSISPLRDLHVATIDDA
jgi:hypothetical protein